MCPLQGGPGLTPASAVPQTLVRRPSPHDAARPRTDRMALGWRGVGWGGGGANACCMDDDGDACVATWGRGRRNEKWGGAGVDWNGRRLPGLDGTSDDALCDVRAGVCCGCVPRRSGRAGHVGRRPGRLNTATAPWLDGGDRAPPHHRRGGHRRVPKTRSADSGQVYSL
jgi:hypothetical protein